MKAAVRKAASNNGMEMISLNPEAISAARVCPGPNILAGIWFAPPTTIATAIVSPNARPNPSKMAARIFEEDARKMTFFTVSHFVAPTDNDASFRESGIALKDSTHNEIIIGKTITARIIAAVNTHNPVL